MHNDTSTAEDAYAAVLDFLNKYPEYKSNDFFVSGESYAGAPARPLRFLGSALLCSVAELTNTCLYQPPSLARHGLRDPKTMQ
jgi:hypothetical protein